MPGPEGRAAPPGDPTGSAGQAAGDSRAPEPALELTVLVPAYNEAAGLAACVRSVRERLGELGVPHEVLVVDDASTDGTGSIADDLAAADDRVRVVHHPRNRGIGGGFVTGVGEARGRSLILIPADLALELAQLPAYLEARARADIVVGVRSDRRDYTPFRRLVSWLNIRAVQVLFAMPLRQFNYICLYDVGVLRRMPVRYSGSAFFHAEVLVRARDMGCRLTEVEVGYVPRTSGHATGANPRLIARTARDMLSFWLERRRGAR